jgi:glucose-1-phosphate thymidylyltransferase
MAKTAVVLAGGLGSRMQKAVDSDVLSDREKELVRKGLKGMILGLDNRPVFDSSVQNLIDAGVERIIFVVNPLGGDIIRAHYGKKIGKVKIDYAVQKEPLGTANAIYCSKRAVGDDSFITMWYDNIYSTKAIKLVLEDDSEWAAVGYDRDGLENPALCNLRKEKVRLNAVMQVDNDFYLLKIVERAKNQDDYASPNGKVLINMGLFKFNKRIFDCIPRIEPVERHPGRKEYEIQPAVQYGIDNFGIKMKILPIYDGVLDLTALEDVAGAKGFTRDRKLRF